MNRLIESFSYWQRLEHSRRMLWLPVFLGAGMAAYFALPFEPAAGWVALPLLAVPLFLLKRLQPFALPVVLLLGFSLALNSAQSRGTILLQKELRFAEIEGRIVESILQGGTLKLTLDKVKIDALPHNETPQKIRFSLRGHKGEPLLTGQRIALRASLMPPSPPVMKGGFDFARMFYFRGIGAVGYAFAPVTLISAENDSADLTLTALRSQIVARIRSHLTGDEGAIAAALMTGEQAGISKRVQETMRVANLSHILSISGLHMALTAGLAYSLARLLLAMNPLTRHLFFMQHQKIAACFALLVGFAYLLLSGMPVSANRAYLMIALLLVGVLLGREVATMRSLALAAFVLLLYDPAALLEAGFQLSFAATAALIAWYERVAKAADAAVLKERPLRRVLLYILALMMTSLVAEAATMPLVLAQFNTLSTYGMLSNLLVMPLVSFMIMPAMLVAFALMPFGAESMALDVMGFGIHLMMSVADWVAALPAAEFYSPAPTEWGYALIILGGLWLLIWRERPRFYGLVAIIIGLSTIALSSPPDMLVSADGKQVAAMLEGELTLLRGNPRNFTTQQWAHGAGEKTASKLSPQQVGWRCDPLGCVLTLKGKIIALPEHKEALAEDCQKADVIIAPFTIWERTCRPPPLIDRRRLQAAGAHWLWLESGRLRHGKGEQQGRVWAQ